MREITARQLGAAVERLFLQAALCPGEDCLDALRDALKTERSPHGRGDFGEPMRECGSGKKTGLPYCQDTGMALVFLEVGQDVHLTGAVEEEVTAGIRAAYEKGYFRKSVLDPITRVNTKDNTPGVIHYSLVPGDKVKITVAPKGSAVKICLCSRCLSPRTDWPASKKWC